MAAKNQQTKVIISTKDILEAYEEHGNDFVVIDIDNIRPYQTYAQYISVHIKKASGEVVPVRFWKMSSSGITVSSRISEPEKRRFAAIRMGLSLYNKNEDGEDEENDNCAALKLLCEAVEAQLEKMKAEGLFTTDKKKSKKVDDKKYRPVYLINTDVVTPMQTQAYDKEKEEYVDIENPRFWISIPKKRFYKDNEKRHEEEHYEDKYYVDEDGQPTEKPIMTYLFDPAFLNIDDFVHRKVSGKNIVRKSFKKLGESEGLQMDNTTIHKLIPKGSAIIGNFRFEITVSARQCKLDVSLTGMCHVRVGDDSYSEYDNVDEDELEAFGSKHAKLLKPKESEEEVEEDDGDDFEDDM